MNESMFFSKREQNVPGTGDDKLEYKMAQLLKPGILNFEIKPENFLKIQPFGTGKNGLNFSRFPLTNPKTSWKICGPRPKSITTFTSQWWGRLKKENEYYLRF